MVDRTMQEATRTLDVEDWHTRVVELTEGQPTSLPDCPPEISFKADFESNGPGESPTPVVWVYGLVKCEEEEQSVQIKRIEEDNPDHYRLCRPDEAPKKLDYALIKDEEIIVYDEGGEVTITWTVN